MHHHLKLHQWGPEGGPTDPSAPPPPPSPYPVHSWQYDEIVFHEPYQSFLNILTSHAPTLLSAVRRNPVPPHEHQQGSTSDVPGERPEFTAVMERDEADRLETVRKTIIAEADDLRLLLQEKEKELDALKKQTED